MNAARISRPSSVRIGMFCKLGSLELSRPVAVPVCEKLVCRRPVSRWISFGSASTYVDLSLAISRYSMIFAGSGCWADNSSKTSAAVDRAFAFPRRALGCRFNLSKRLSASCVREIVIRCGRSQQIGIELRRVPDTRRSAREQLKKLRIVDDFLPLRIGQQWRKRFQRFALLVHPDGASFASFGRDLDRSDARSE